MSSQVIGLVAHPEKPGARELVETLVAGFDRHGAAIRLEQRTAELIGKASTASVAELGGLCEMIVVLGGDGTLLQVLHDLGDNLRPIFGINLGSLGFLTCVSSADSEKAVKAICAGEFVLSKRSLLRVEMERDGKVVAEATGLNDMVISRGSLSRLIRLETRIDDAVLTVYNADGLIVATPTGSTAYSLASGGPILAPDSAVFVITPICPHVLTNRSVIVGDNSRIEVRPSRDEPEVYLTVDGQELHRVEQGDVIRISKSPRELQLAMLQGTTFFEVLRQKLKWSGSAV